jgi:hypothetical protein
MRANHIPFAPIFIAASGAGPDAAWMTSAERNIDAIRSLPMSPPDHLVFATWHREIFATGSKLIVRAAIATCSARGL